MKKFYYIILIIISVFINSFALYGGKPLSKDSLLILTKSDNYYIKTNAFILLTKSAKTANIAQQYIDSAEYYYKLAPIDSNLMFIYYYKAFIKSKLNKYHESIRLYKKALVLAKKTTKKDREPYIIKQIALNFYYGLDYDSAYYYNTKSYALYYKLLKSDTNNFKTKCYNYADGLFDAGKSLFRLCKYDLAIENMYRSLRYFEKINEHKKLIDIHTNLGNVFFRINNYDKAYSEYLEVIKLQKLHFPKLKLIIIYLNLGNLFLAKQEYDSSLYYYNKYLTLIVNYKSYQNNVGYVYNNMALVFKHQELYDSAFSYFEKANKIFIENNYKIGYYKTKLNMGITYIKMGKYKQGEKLLSKLEKTFDKNKNAEAAKEMYLGLSIANETLHNSTKALDYLKKYHAFKDSLASVKVQNKINDYKEQYETEKKDREIEQLQQLSVLQQKDKEKQEAIVEKQKLITILLTFLAIALLAILFGLLRYYKMRYRKNQELMKKNEQINKQKVVDLIKNQEVRSINSFMNGQEKERARIASELHDRLGVLLSTVKLHFSSLDADLSKNEEEHSSFKFALDLLDNSVDEVRSISHNLSKEILTHFNLIKEIENLTEAINTAGNVQINFIRIGPEFPLKPEVEIEIFRIIQELVTNAIKHSQSEEVFIQLISDDETLTISIEDHGIGFDIKKIKSNGLGLKNIKLRAEKIGGIYNHESAPGKGTSIIIEIHK